MVAACRREGRMTTNNKIACIAAVVVAWCVGCGQGSGWLAIAAGIAVLANGLYFDEGGKDGAD
jgi:O-antigen ligase